jgi:hypothetical protein
MESLTTKSEGAKEKSRQKANPKSERKDAEQFWNKRASEKKGMSSFLVS